MAAGARARDVDTPDGRVIRVAELGEPDGAAVVFHHGWPGCRLLPHSFDEAARERGVRLISYDRAGYGGSSPKPGRRIADAAADTATVADALGVARFAVWGVSGGGPHALACGGLLPGRVSAVAAVSSFAPADTPGFVFTDGMGEPSRAEFALATEGGDAYESFVREAVAQTLALPPERVVESLDGLLAGPDPDLLAGPLGRYQHDATREALAAGIEGWLDDGLAAVAPWGLDPSSITVPVLLLQGAHDLMVPPAHARVLAGMIPHATCILEPDEGHLTVCFDPARPLDWLMGRGSI